jgi:DNA-binding transcriptional regulator YdaS (Cro superfamily)
MTRRRNKLAAYFEAHPEVTKLDFSRLIGVTPSYVSQLTSDNPPWPGRSLSLKIAKATGGAVTPNDLAGYQLAAE